MRWFDLTTKDLIWKHVIWFGFDLNLSWFDLICDLKKSQVSVGYLTLLLKEYGPVNNHFFMDILPKYVASFFGNSGTPVFNLWRHNPIKTGSAEDWFLCFLDINFLYTFSAQTIRILFFIIILFSIYMNLHSL